MAHLVPDVLGVVLGFVDGIKPLVRLSSCSRQFRCSVKEVVNLKAIAATREGFILKQGETWIEALRFLELRDGQLGLNNQQGEIWTEVIRFIERRDGQLGLNNLLNLQEMVRVALTGLRVVQVSTGFNNTAAVTANGELYTFGLGILGQLVRPPTANELVPQLVEGALDGQWVVSVATGHAHTVVLTASGAVFTFGQGADGRLGHGTNDWQFSPFRVEALVGRRVIRVAAGLYHTAVLTDDGVVLTFGYNRSGQLGRAYDQAHSSLPGVVELDALAGERVVGLVIGYSGTGLEMSSGRLVTFGDPLVALNA
jgi:hypothetical protein